MSESVRSALARVVAGDTLSRADARSAMGTVMDGEATPAQLAGLLIGLRVRGETVEELAGFAEAMRARVLTVRAPAGAVDTCGTGGDGAATFNISTAAALVVAGAGVPVAKHGNRAVTSRSGSADVLEALGVPVDHGPDDAAAALARHGFAFLFAPTYHPAMRHAGPVRRELGVPTCFNLLGPLTNPAGVRRQVVGVADPTAAARVARVLHALGTDRALVVHGDGVDELPLDDSGVLYDVSPMGVRRRRIDARRLGLRAAQRSELAGGDAEHNARLIQAILAGSDRGPRRDVVVLNAGAALLAAGRARTLAGGVAQAAEAIDSGAAVTVLDQITGSARPRSAA
ncbi:MAG TPA: anthranilate phosphoribosyltransferase [Candidatus Limnocylindrales bacterium]|nr:anthranilate phosphoribosyltransferase [Candidatus Limnocylindrales bacterium]